MLFTIAKTPLATNPSKDIKDLCNKNYKVLKKEIQNDIKRWKILLLSCMAKLIL
jgi:hypothetical protein